MQQRTAAGTIVGFQVLIKTKNSLLGEVVDEDLQPVP